ncbi:F-box/LRR-repeat protein 17 isoform X2 [Sphaerodactylus townsendi]|uniref:F-box/LRR-repeat protein 17 isoform X2 n=1 Tax=Sphaerodactylus townsendi TaxID=933632 RepID=UPI002025DD2C|nr:F-box/LRR-repeat protein 17 isoform X2 [Sphaerodactylus townsendi]
MGHFLSRKGASLNAERSRRRSRSLRGKVPPRVRNRSCFLRGPCMLCFLVHGASSSARQEPPPPAHRGSPSPPPQLLYAALKDPEERAACRLLRLSPLAAAAWEARGRRRRCRRLLLSGLLLSSPPPPAPPPPPRGFLGPALQTGEVNAEMVCKRKGVGLPACPPCKQPRCAPGTGVGAESPSPPPEAADCQQGALPEAHLCPLPCASDCAQLEATPRDPAGEDRGGKRGPPSESASPPPELGGRETQESRDPDCEEPPEDPGDCCPEPQSPSPDINELPPSILLKIFSNLSLNERCLSASLVCKYWHDLCLDFHFWKQLDLSNRQQVTDELLEKITSRSQNITEINISDCRNISDTGVCVLAFKCPGLLRYTAYRCKQLSDTSIIAVASQCPQLQKVHVGNQDRLTDEGLKQLGSKCRELKDIHFGQCYKISDEGMVVIAKGCLKLQRIYMQENKLVTDQSVKAFAEHCPQLQYVGFMGCSVTSKGVIHLTNLRNLSSLDLRHITELDNETVMEIVKRCKNLTSLNLCLNWIINDRCVEVIAKEGQNLKELYLVSCKITDYALIAIGRYSMTIETVDVGWCKEITDQGATQIAQSSKSLRYLGLMRCDKVNEVTVEQLVQQHPHITFSTVLQDCKRTLERAYQMGWTPSMSTAS